MQDTYNAVESVIRSKRMLVQYFSNSVYASVSGFVYTEFIIQFRPVEKKGFIEIPHVDNVIKFIKEQMVPMLTDKLLDTLVSQEHQIKEINDNREDMQVILEGMVIPDLLNFLPKTIRMKFKLKDKPNAQFHEIRDRYLMNNRPVTDAHLKYIAEEIALFYLYYHAKKDLAEAMEPITLDAHSFMEITHQTAIEPIMVDIPIIQNRAVMDHIDFVSDITSSVVDNKGIIQTKGFSKLKIYDNIL